MLLLAALFHRGAGVPPANVFAYPPYQALLAQGINTLSEFMMMDLADFDKLTVPASPTVPERDLLISERKNLIALAAWYHDKCRDSGTLVNPKNLQRADFLEYKITGLRLDKTIVHYSLSLNTDSHALTSWRKTIRLSRQDYPQYRDEASFLKFREKYEAMARAHGIAHVLQDPDLPLPVDEQADAAQREWMMTTLESSILNPSAKGMLNKYIKTQQTREFWKEFCNDASSSRAAEIRMGTQSNFITSVRFKDVRWRGTLQSQLAHYDDQYRQFLEYSGGEIISDKMRVLHLKNACQGTPVLENVYTTLSSARHAAGIHSMISYADFMEALKAEAQVIDSSRPTSRGQRVNQHDMYGYDEDYIDQQDGYMLNVHDHDINTPISELLQDEPQGYDAYQAEMQRRIPPQDRSPSNRRNMDHVVGKETWDKIDRTDRGHWVKMTPTSRALVLGDRTSKKSTTSQSRTSSGYPGITAKTHDLETAHDGSNQKEDDQEPGEIIASTHRQQRIKSNKTVQISDDSTLKKKKSQSSDKNKSQDSDNKKKPKEQEPSSTLKPQKGVLLDLATKKMKSKPGQKGLDINKMMSTAGVDPRDVTKVACNFHEISMDDDDESFVSVRSSETQELNVRMMNFSGQDDDEEDDERPFNAEDAYFFEAFDDLDGLEDAQYARFIQEQEYQQELPPEEPDQVVPEQLDAAILQDDSVLQARTLDEAGGTRRAVRADQQVTRDSQPIDSRELSEEEQWQMYGLDRVFTTKTGDGISPLSQDGGDQFPSQDDTYKEDEDDVLASILPPRIAVGKKVAPHGHMKGKFRDVEKPSPLKNRIKKKSDGTGLEMIPRTASGTEYLTMNTPVPQDQREAASRNRLLPGQNSSTNPSGTVGKQTGATATKATPVTSQPTASNQATATKTQSTPPDGIPNPNPQHAHYDPVDPNASDSLSGSQGSQPQQTSRKVTFSNEKPATSKDPDVGTTPLVSTFTLRQLISFATMHGYDAAIDMAAMISFQVTPDIQVTLRNAATPTGTSVTDTSQLPAATPPEDVNTGTTLPVTTQPGETSPTAVKEGESGPLQTPNESEGATPEVPTETSVAPESTDTSNPPATPAEESGQRQTPFHERAPLRPANSWQEQRRQAEDDPMSPEDQQAWEAYGLDNVLNQMETQGNGSPTYADVVQHGDTNTTIDSVELGQTPNTAPHDPRMPTPGISATARAPNSTTTSSHTHHDPSDFTIPGQLRRRINKKKNKKKKKMQKSQQSPSLCETATNTLNQLLSPNPTTSTDSNDSETPHPTSNVIQRQDQDGNSSPSQGENNENSKQDFHRAKRE